MFEGLLLNQKGLQSVYLNCFYVLLLCLLVLLFLFFKRVNIALRKRVGLKGHVKIKSHLAFEMRSKAL